MPELAHNMGLLVSLTEAQLRRMDAQLQHQQVCAWGLGALGVGACAGVVAVLQSLRRSCRRGPGVMQVRISTQQQPLPRAA